ncbi:MAG: NAD(P)/FAD-dependent oxidoreductase [Bacteroidales bacterium]|nr:NAD(P)/FAD-dependent oxidoreductase [Bacteroidales bacterium]
MKTTDVLIVGGSAAGMVTALTGKSHFPDKEFTLVKKQKEVMVPCGIPYIFGTMENSEKNLMPVDASMEKNGIKSIVDEAIKIHSDKHQVEFASGEFIRYKKLVVATGSTPVKPSWLKGADLENVFTIPKEKGYLDNMNTTLKSMKNVAVIGAGFIGVELSDELNKRGINVTLIEKLPQILNLAFDEELSSRIHEMLEKRGVNIVTGKGIQRVIGDQKVESIELEDGTIMEMDAVVLSMGYILY